MDDNQLENKKNLTIALVLAFASPKETPTKAVVEEKAKILAPMSLLQKGLTRPSHFGQLIFTNAHF